MVYNGDEAQGPLHGVAAQEDVLPHRAGGDGLELLVDHGNAHLQRLHGVGNGHLLPLKEDLPLVHLVDAEHALHQRGLPCAVFPHEGVNRAGAEAELCVIQGLDAREGFAHAPHFQAVLAHKQTSYLL